MQKRVAKKGKNAGGEFWGCSTFPKCRGTLSIDGGGNPVDGQQNAAVPNPVGQPAVGSVGNPKRVLWADGTLRRDGWKCQHISLSGSLRSHVISKSGFAESVFVARQDLLAYQPASADTRRVIDIWNKVLSRGTASPIHPAAERALLEIEGFGTGDFRPPTHQGDLAPRVVRPQQLELAVAVDTEISIDDVTGSDAEHEFVTWLIKSQPMLIPFVTPQAAFEQSITGRGGESDGCRRVDFLICLPDGTSVVVEIDGQQHAGQILTDQDRDQSLASVGIQTIRIPTSELQQGKGPNLDKVVAVSNLVGKSANQTTVDPLTWAPILLHRFAYAIGEAIASGFLAGTKWVISLSDPTFKVASLVGPYLEMLWALDRFWGDSSLSPNKVIVSSGQNTYEYKHVGDGRYEQTQGSAEAGDVHIDLDATRPPMAQLIADPELPTIVTRTASIGVGVSRLPTGGSNRVTARTGTEDTERALTIMLQAIFAKEQFRSGQYEAVAELIAGRDCCVLLPTGAGKSLIYQLAGLCMPGRTLIIDPIVSLIEDQVGGLNIHGIDRAIGITSFTTRKGQTDSLLRDVADADAYFVFVAPERLQMSSFRSALRELATVTPINLTVIDEAHCVSEWGHQFRTSYLGLGKVIRDVAVDGVGNPPPLVALTGTASRAVLRDVLFQLSIREQNANTIIRPATFDRKELNYRIIRSDPGTKEVTLRSALKTLPNEFNESLATFYQPDGERTYSGLVFVPTVNGKSNGLLSTQDIVKDVCPSTGIYSGSAPKGINPNQWNGLKRSYADSFKQNETTALVATNAFGMGIDKPNIRWVIHYGLSGSIESYYQEVGRAGRNGQQAQCVLVLSEFDPARNSQLLAEDVNLEEARARSDNFKWNERDDVTTALFFHTSSFPGIPDEENALRELVQQLSPSGSKQLVEIPFDGDDDRQERALHRLVILDVIDDYLVEFGSKKFVVTLNGSDGNSVKDSLLAYVERTQPGRVEEMSNRVNAVNQPHHDTIVRCGSMLVEFVYETVERSRRRSLREMLLAARNSNSDEELRNRVLEYLSEGDVGNVLEELVDMSTVNLTRWTTEWSSIMSKTDAAEWRASSARLLASYPDHPGLLLSRGLAELLDSEDGQVSAAAIDEYILNLESALQSATPLYNIPREQVQKTITWLINKIESRNPAASAATISVAERYDALDEEDRARLKLQSSTDLASAIVDLDQTLINIYHLTEMLTVGAKK